MIPKIPGKQIKKLPWLPDDFLEVLSYYDGPRIALQKDAVGKLYIGWWNDEDETPANAGCTSESVKERLKKALEWSDSLPSRLLITPRTATSSCTTLTWSMTTRAQALAAAPANIPPSSLPLPGAQLSAALSCGCR